MPETPDQPARPAKPKHDAGCKSLLAHRRTVEDILRALHLATAVGDDGERDPQPSAPRLKDLAARLDYSTLESMPADFVTEHLGRRHADMLWRTRTFDGQHLLVHFEFQATVDRGMALRAMNYAGGIWAGLRSDRPVSDLVGPGGVLPLVLAVVVYIGRRRWTAPRELRDLMASAPEELLGSRSQHRYLPIDLWRVDPASLAEDSVLAMIAALERARSPGRLGKLAPSVIDWAERAGELELRDRFREWIVGVFSTPQLRLRIHPNPAAFADLDQFAVCFCCDLATVYPGRFINRYASLIRANPPPNRGAVVPEPTAPPTATLA